MINISERTPFTILYIILYCKTRGLLASLRLFWRTTPPSQNEACLQTEQKLRHDLTLHVSPILQSLIKKSLWFIFLTQLYHSLYYFLYYLLLYYYIEFVMSIKANAHDWLTGRKKTPSSMQCTTQHQISAIVSPWITVHFKAMW